MGSKKEMILKKFKEYREKVNRQQREISKRIIGLESFIEKVLICVYAHAEWDLVPHILSEAWVGEGKTVTLKTFADTVAGAEFSRIQFRSDTKPKELLEVVSPDLKKISRGPLFTQFLLADEVNRAPGETKSAMIEAMGEAQITLHGVTHRLGQPFFVMATENPSEEEGVYLLGAAESDRYMMKAYVDPLTEEQEIKIAELHEEKTPKIKQVITREDILNIRDFIRKYVYVSPEHRRYMVRIVRALRPGVGIVDPEEFPLTPKGRRGYLFLQRGVKVRAFLKGRLHVIPEDIRVLAFPILHHRFRSKYYMFDTEKMKEVTGKLIRKAIVKVMGDDEARKISETQGKKT